MSNTDFARMLDWEQQTDLELEDEQSLDKVEHRAFIERCRRAKVSYTKLKKYEKEVDAETADIKEEINALEWRLKHCRIGEKRKRYANIYLQSDFDKWRTQLADKRRQLDNIINRIHDKYFK
jgi:hypothetical protein